MQIPQNHGDPHQLDPTHNRMLYALIRRRRDQRSQGWVSIGELMVETRSTQQEVVSELRSLFAHYKLESIAGNGIVTNRYRLDPSLDIQLEALPEPQPRVRPKPEPLADDPVEEPLVRRGDVPAAATVAVASAAPSQPSHPKAPSKMVDTPPPQLDRTALAPAKSAGNQIKGAPAKQQPKKPQTRVAIALVDAVRIGQQAVEVMLKEAPPVRAKAAQKPKIAKPGTSAGRKAPVKAAAKKPVPTKTKAAKGAKR